MGLPRCHEHQNVEYRTYNVSSIIIGPYGDLSYPVSAILLCFRRPNNPFDRSYVDVADVRYNASKIENKVGTHIRDNSHSNSQPKS